MSSTPSLEQRLVVFAPTGRDAVLAQNVLQAAGLRADTQPTIEALCSAVVAGTGAVLIAEEALVPENIRKLSDHLHSQPSWSDLPILVLSGTMSARNSPEFFRRMVELLGNVTVLDRPLHIATLVTAAQAALRARRRQYQARESLLALEAQEAALKQADQRKDEFLAMLAHELRNPLAAISMALSLLDRSELAPDRAARHRSTAKRQVANLVRLVDDLLDVSRITRGTVELRKGRIDLAQTVHSAVSAARPAIEARQHELTLTVSPGPFILEADSTRLEQVVSNLLSNAAKYTPSGGRIQVLLTRQQQEDEQVAVLTVADSGRGIPSHMLSSIFDLFVQVAPEMDRSTGGLGLGLTLVKRLVEMHGGSVEARSEGNARGTQFIIRLPLLATATARGERPEANPERPPRLPPRRIALVEDSDDIRESMKDVLKDMGHEVLVAASGPEGVQIILDARPDLAFVDIGLPGLNGYDVAKNVREKMTSEAVLLVALTGYGGPNAKRLAEEAGFDRYVVKPVKVEDLPGLIACARSR